MGVASMGVAGERSSRGVESQGRGVAGEWRSRGVV